MSDENKKDWVCAGYHCKFKRINAEGMMKVDAKESCRIIHLRNEISRLTAQRDKLLEYAKELSETLEQEYSSVYKELEDLIAEIEAEKGNKYRKAFYHPRGYGVAREDDEEVE